MAVKFFNLACLVLLSSFTILSLHGQEQKAGSRFSGDWPMFGGDISRNQVNESTGVSFEFRLPKQANRDEEIEPGEKVLWMAKLGSQTYGSTVDRGRLYVVSIKP